MLARHRDAELFIPASGAKLLTTSAALLLLPADTRWVTAVHGVIGPAGAVEGPLRLVGGGDPKLMPGHLDGLAERLKAAGVASVPGGLVVDASRYDADTLPPAYDQKDTDAGYRPSIGAAASNFGAVRVHTRPGAKRSKPPRVEIEPATAAVEVVNQARTVQGKARQLRVAGEPRQDGRLRVRVTGTIGGKARADSERKRVADGDLLSGWLLLEALQRRGVAVAGPPRVARVAASADPGPELARIESADLASTIADINTWSNNFMAETLLKELGHVEGAGPATWDRAVERATGALTALGLPPEGFRLVNGSGLYVATHVAPATMTLLLARLAADPARGPPLADSLAVAGSSGTLARRLRGKRTRGKVRAKTGTLDEVISLSGHLTTRTGRRLAFCILINDGTPNRTASFRRAIDTLVTRLAGL